MKSPIVLLDGLLQDIRRLEPDVKGTERDVITLGLRYEHEGYGFLTKALPTLGDALRLGLSTRKFACPSGFSKIHRGALPKLFSGLLCEVFESSSGLLKENPNLGVVKCLNEALYLFKKLKLDQQSEEVLDMKARLGFFETDEACIEESSIPDDMRHHFEHVCRLVLPDLVNSDLTDLPCKHGPGAVVEPTKGNQKWSLLFKDLCEENFDADEFGYGDFMFSHSSNEDLLSPLVDSTEVERRRASRSISKLISVPKNSTSRRTITIEPLSRQFVQQGLNTVLRDSISQCPVLRESLDLSDQTKNQVLALEGSRTGKWATLDLKSASDLLSSTLVRIIFGRHTAFYNAMISCRSTKVKDHKKVVELRKFAGMGNALTFPVQSVAFALLAIAAILHQDGHKPSMWKVKRASRLVRVFGDDIIVHTDYVQRVVVWLQSFGLAVNTKKSFIEGNFRESCGLDAFMGVDVTPLYLKVRPDDSSNEPNSIAALVSLSNQAWLRGLYKFSAILKDEVEIRLRRRLPLTRQQSGGLGWHTRLNSSDIHSWNRNLHRFEQKTCVLVPLKRKDKLDGVPALLKFFHVPLVGRGKNHLKESQQRFSSRIVVRKVPA